MVKGAPNAAHELCTASRKASFSVVSVVPHLIFGQRDEPSGCRKPNELIRVHRKGRQLKTSKLSSGRMLPSSLENGDSKIAEFSAESMAHTKILAVQKLSGAQHPQPSGSTRIGT